MKKLIVTILTLTTCVLSYGQRNSMFGKNPLLNKPEWDKQRVHWGYYLGGNFLNYKLDYTEQYYKNIQELKVKYPNIPTTTEVQVTSTMGFNVGLIGNLRLFEYLDLRFEPGLAYSKRELHIPSVLIHDYIVNHGTVILDPATMNTYSVRQDSSTYLHFPLLLKFSALRSGNVRPYVLAGVSADLNLTSNANSTDENPTIWRTQKWTTNYELGFGIDIYFEYFKFSPSIRGVFGIDDAMIHDTDPDSPWTGNINSMKTRGVFLNFTFH